MINTYNTMKSFNALLSHGYIVQCPCCQAYNAYAYQDVNMVDNRRMVPSDGIKDTGKLYTKADVLSNWPDVYSIGTCDGLGSWQCGKCKQYLVSRDSILLAECYTHIDPAVYDQDDL